MTSFHRLSLLEKRQWLLTHTELNSEDMAWLEQTASMQDRLTSLSENVVGGMTLPFSMVPNVMIAGQHYCVPMSVEESSVVAAVNRMAKISRQQGQLSYHVEAASIAGELYIPKRYRSQLFAWDEHFWLTMLNDTVAKSMVRRGGGVNNISCLHHEDHSLIHLNMQPCDAQGANFACQVSFYLKEQMVKHGLIENGYAILSNRSSNLSHATLRLENQEPNWIAGILDMQTFAEQSEARATTHNKGIINGIDAVLVATGNDWRANSAACYDYATRSGRHLPLSTWQSPEPGILLGNLRLPLQVGSLGGAVSAHPLAQLALKLLGQPNRETLSGIIACVGLLQNLSAIEAIATGRLVQGHMNLHLQNLLNLHPDKTLAELKKQLKEKGYVSSE